jgi:hypothetical protein
METKKKSDNKGCFIAGVIILAIAAASSALLIIVDYWLNK